MEGEGRAVNKMPWDIPCMPAEEGERRHRAIRELMELRGIDCLIIAGHQGNYGARAANIRYVANYSMWHDDEYVVFPLSGEPGLFTWSDGHADWAERLSWIPVKGTGKAKHLANIVGYLASLQLQEGTLGLVDLETMPAYLYQGLLQRLPRATFVAAGDLIKQLRAIKGPIELEFVRRAAACADQGFEAMREAARPGVSDREVWTACEQALTLEGAEPPSFTLYVSGPWWERGRAMPYGPTNRTLQAGDILLNEITPSYGGYWVQLCRPIVLGEVLPAFQQAYDTQVELYQLVARGLRPGVGVDAIEAQVRALAIQRGCDAGRPWALQHIGLEISDKMPSRTVLKAGMTYVNHPYTQYPPKQPVVGGHIVGDTFLITDSGSEALTKIPLQLTVVG